MGKNDPEPYKQDIMMNLNCDTVIKNPKIYKIQDKIKNMIYSYHIYV